MQPSNEKLTTFLKNNTKNNLAEIAFHCGAVRLIKHNVNYSTGDRQDTYEFMEDVLEDEFTINHWESPYFLLHIPNNSYILYEISDKKIIVWVCFTEEKSRNKGYMKLLLKKLTSIHPKKRCCIDTYNPTLQHICQKQGIRI